MNKLATLLLFAACNRAPKTEAIDPNKPTATAVDEIPKEIPEYPAVIWTKDTRVVSNEVSAKVTKIWVKPGQHVKKGDLLLEISDEELQGRARSAEAQIRQAKAAAGAAYADANNAQRKARVQGQLYRGGAGTLEAVKDASSTADSAGAKGLEAEERANGGKADLAEVQRLIARCKVTAEIDGIVVYINAKEGVVPNKGQSLARIADTSDLRVRFVVPVADVKKLQKGQKINVFIQNHDEEIPATVMEFTGTAENHVDVAVVEADIDDSKLKQDELSATGQGFVRIANTGGKS